MNIAVRTFSGACLARPDTTKAKVNEDIYLPEFVTEVSCAPVVFARITRPGRSISARFASRYFDALSYGVLLYPENLISIPETGFATASCLDHTTCIPAEFFDPTLPGSKENEFILAAGGRELFRTVGIPEGFVEENLSEITKYIYIRTGDLAAIELAPRIPLLGKNSSVIITGQFSGKKTIETKVEI
ncbi:MAG: hypothetical protein MJY43_01495 [Bacteroidales bacterium]|nr:hypothetical protein [Bacteroidales bacterium]